MGVIPCLWWLGFHFAPNRFGVRRNGWALLIWLNENALLERWRGQDGANLVLETAAILVVHHALVDDGEAQAVAVGGREVTAEAADARNGARLGVNVAACEGACHALAQGAVGAGNG